MMNDIEKRKKEIYADLEELETEIEILKRNIREYRQGLANVKTEEDVINFQNQYELERGLNTILLL